MVIRDYTPSDAPAIRALLCRELFETDPADPDEVAKVDLVARIS